MGRLDILVCGQCHSVFHFIEEFQEHRAKEGACSKVSHFRENNDVRICNLGIILYYLNLYYINAYVYAFVECAEGTSLGVPFVEKLADSTRK
jgi:hypothetical protein